MIRVDIPHSRHTIRRNVMGAGIHPSDAYAVWKASGGRDKRARDLAIYSRRDDQNDFRFPARGTMPAGLKPFLNGPPYVADRHMLVADQDLSQFSNEITFNWAPLL